MEAFLSLCLVLVAVARTALVVSKWHPWLWGTVARPDSTDVSTPLLLMPRAVAIRGAAISRAARRYGLALSLTAAAAASFSLAISLRQAIGGILASPTLVSLVIFAFRLANAVALLSFDQLIYGRVSGLVLTVFVLACVELAVAVATEHARLEWLFTLTNCIFALFIAVFQHGGGGRRTAVVDQDQRDEDRMGNKLRYDALSLSFYLTLKEAGKTLVLILTHGPDHTASSTILTALFDVLFNLGPLVLALMSRVGWPWTFLPTVWKKRFLLGLLYLLTLTLFVNGIGATCRAKNAAALLTLGDAVLLARGSARALLLMPLLVFPRLTWVLSTATDMFLELGILGHMPTLHQHLAWCQGTMALLHTAAHIQLVAGRAEALRTLLGAPIWTQLWYPWVTGWVVVLGFCLALSALFYRTTRHKNFIWLHRLGAAVAIAVASIHGARAILSPPKFPWGAAAMAVVLVWNQLGMLTDTVLGNVRGAEEGDGEQIVVEVELTFAQLGPYFTAGKWLQLRLNGTWHPFTIARAAPTQKTIYLYISRTGQDTRTLVPGHGYTFQVRGAFPSPMYRGLSDDVDAVIMVVGGIGLTTAMSLVERCIMSRRPLLLVIIAREPVYLRLASRFFAAVVERAPTAPAPWTVRFHYTGSAIDQSSFKFMNSAGHEDPDAIVSGRPTGKWRTYFGDFGATANAYYADGQRIHGMACDTHAYCCISNPALLKDVHKAANEAHVEFYREVFN